MHGELTTKRSPIVLMWKFAMIEAGAFFLYFIATLLGNTKYEIYAQLSLTSVLSYQTAKILFVFGAQFFLIVYAFLSWYYEEYTVRADTYGSTQTNSITHAYGVFRKKSKTFESDKSAKISVRPGILGNFFHYGSIGIDSGKRTFVLRHISRPERVVKILNGEYDYEVGFGKKPDAAKLLHEDEHAKLEFKSSLRFDYKSGNPNRDMEKAAMKTVAALLNSGGGYLVIGVNDKRHPVGLAKDYSLLQRKDKDGFENHFTQAFNNMIGPEFRGLVKLWFDDLEGHEVCVIQTAQSPRPVYLKIDTSEYFYVRTGNISTPLRVSEIESYLRSRWPKRLS